MSPPLSFSLANPVTNRASARWSIYNLNLGGVRRLVDAEQSALQKTRGGRGRNQSCATTVPAASLLGAGIGPGEGTSAGHGKNEVSLCCRASCVGLWSARLRQQNAAPANIVLANDAILSDGCAAIACHSVIHTSPGVVMGKGEGRGALIRVKNDASVDRGPMSFGWLCSRADPGLCPPAEQPVSGHVVHIISSMYATTFASVLSACSYSCVSDKGAVGLSLLHSLLMLDLLTESMPPSAKALVDEASPLPTQTKPYRKESRVKRSDVDPVLQHQLGNRVRTTERARQRSGKDCEVEAGRRRAGRRIVELDGRPS